MSPSNSTVGAAPTDYQLRDWTVQPERNRLTRGDQLVRVEPKLMDVLSHLARHAGEVVAKDQLVEAVWSDVFVTDSVITRAIAGLRRALEDDARNPDYIETIAKRGYRLMVHPEWHPASTAARSPQRPAEPSYAVGQWVRGRDFYGRQSELSEILEGPRNWLWLLGNRAVGKTSVLKQAELLAGGEQPPRYVPLFWDLQGTASLGELNADFASLLEDSVERFERYGIHVRELASDDLFRSLGKLCRQLRSRRLTLLLLCDEVEQLLHLRASAPTLLSKLRRAFQSQEGIRTVMASSSRLWELTDESGVTSPFLHGLAPPLYLGSLDAAAATALIGQEQSECRAAINGEQAAAITAHCGRHPYLLQQLSAASVDGTSLAEAAEAVAGDPAVKFFFDVDFGLLSPAEQQLLTELAGGEESATEEQIAGAGQSGPTSAALRHLVRLGMVEAGVDGQLAVSGTILRRLLLTRR